MAGRDTTAQSGKLMEVATDVKWVKKTLEDLVVEMRKIGARVGVIENKQAMIDQKYIESKIRLDDMVEKVRENTKFREELLYIVKHWKAILGVIGTSGIISALSAILTLYSKVA